MVHTKPHNLTSIQTGLTASEALGRHKNVITTKDSEWRLIVRIAWGQVTTFFFVLIFVSGCITFFFGAHKDALILFAINAINLILGFAQEYKANKATQKLQKLVSTTSRVIRDGQLITIDSNDIVEGDILKLIGGDIIPVDALVRKSESALLDESIRTGETVPRNVKDDQMLYSGTSLVSGEITAQVLHVGNATSIAQYSKKLGSLQRDKSFESLVKGISMWVFFIALISILIAGVLSLWVFHVQTPVEFLLFSISLILGIVPESLPLIITLILSNSALILSKQKAIVKRLSSLEEMGGVNFLLTDKTGTLTQNTIKVSTIKDFHNLRETMQEIGFNTYERSPMDSVFDGAITTYFGHPTHRPHEIHNFDSFTSKTGYARFAFADKTIVRGQFKPVLKLCRKAPQDIEKTYEELEHLGLRVIAFATADHGEHEYILNGLIAFEDPLKLGAEHIIAKAEEYDVDIKIITGDSLAVAEYIAHKLRLIHTEKEVVSLENVAVSNLTDAQLLNTQVFAKCTPEQKLALIERYTKMGVVAFLGEGINDALALKRANVGLVVHNSSDIAKQSADILLTEKSLSPILRAVLMGRKAYVNIVTYLICTLSGNAGTLFSLIIILFVWKTIPLLPIHILLNNLLTDIPLFLLVYDNVSKFALHHKPYASVHFIVRRLFIYGLVSTLFDMVFFLMFFHVHPEFLRSEWFVFGVWSELVFIMSIRTEMPIWKAPPIGKALFFATFIVGLVTLALAQIPFLSSIFSLSPLPWPIVGALVLVCIARLAGTELVKLWLFDPRVVQKEEEQIEKIQYNTSATS